MVLLEILITYPQSGIPATTTPWPKMRGILENLHVNQYGSLAASLSYPVTDEDATNEMCCCRQTRELVQKATQNTPFAGPQL